MSSVYARKRALSELQFYKTGQELQTAITKFVMNEKRLPKKWRNNIGNRLISTVDSMMDNIIAANSIFPTDEDLLKKRSIYQAYANNNCFQIQNQLIRMYNCVPTVTLKSLSGIIKLLHHEKNLIKNWKKSNKIMSVKN